MSDAAKVDDYNEDRRYTYADYLEWEGPQRYQLFNGQAFQMASPSVEHQAILIDKVSINGAPDLVIEIASPSNARNELLLKFQYYLKAGVREYWVIVPEQRNVQVHLYEKGRYISALYEDNERIPVTVLPGLEIALEDLFKKNE